MQDLLPSLQILDGRKGSRSQTAPGGRDVGAEPAKAKKRKASLSKDQVEAPEGHVSEKTAKKRRVTLSEQQEELPQRNEEAAGTGQTGWSHLDIQTLKGFRVSHAHKHVADLDALNALSLKTAWYHFEHWKEPSSS